MMTKSKTDSINKLMGAQPMKVSIAQLAAPAQHKPIVFDSAKFQAQMSEAAKNITDPCGFAKARLN